MNPNIETFINTSMPNFPFGEYGNTDTIKAAIYKAYIDFQPRTIKGHKEFDHPKEKVAEWLSVKLAEYFNEPKKSQEVYNFWHQKVCSDFV